MIGETEILVGPFPLLVDLDGIYDGVDFLFYGTQAYQLIQLLQCRFALDGCVDLAPHLGEGPAVDLVVSVVYRIQEGNGSVPDDVVPACVMVLRVLDVQGTFQDMEAYKNFRDLACIIIDFTGPVPLFQDELGIFVLMLQRPVSGFLFQIDCRFIHGRFQGTVREGYVSGIGVKNFQGTAG